MAGLGMGGDAVLPAGGFVGAEDGLTEEIIGVFYEVYKELGFGFLESVYGRAMELALRQASLRVDAEVPLPVRFRGAVIGLFKADLLVEGLVIVELKVADSISKAHEAQLRHYLRSCDVEVGLILSFGESPRVRRVQFMNERKVVGLTEG